MGIPKFYRYISERYPCINQLVEDDQMPEFDNYYLDMNGIIHNCSHPDDMNIKLDNKFVFKEIFKYVDLLFHYVKPKKVFFMAIDGVAPRAKMNQQRGRRFRTAEENEKMKEKLEKQLKVGSPPELFDSNCITPGTVFMDELHEHLKYFVVWKLSTDPLWQKCEQIIYSGHQTPGEGEHKIMDYIRYVRSQPDYDPNTRHCIYGLDADLIILGLSTHDLHFTLFREEVRYGRKKRVPSNVDDMRFYLLHISLLRCYIHEEFACLKDTLPFQFDLEKIIDDLILFLFLIGNDFIPNLPNFLIGLNSIAALFDVYKGVLPKLKGYLNDNGLLNLDNFQCFLNQLSTIDMDKFEEHYDNVKYMESKTGRKLFDSDEDDCLDEDNSSPTNDNHNGHDELFMLNQFKKYKSDYYNEKLEMNEENGGGGGVVSDEFLRKQSQEYIKAIQWILHYYYDGVCSWSWYYPQHYAPYISDIKDISDLKLQFELGKPFKAFEQLLSVLPAPSRGLLPKPYQYLMVDEQSPIIDYYPTDFVLDKNGKLNDWEAVVRIPFIDEKKLINTMESINSQLTDEEKRRNEYGPFYIYSYSKDQALGKPYKAPSGLPHVLQNFTVIKELNYDHYYLPRDKIRKGLLPNADLGSFYYGFPTLDHVQFKTSISKPLVRVFEQRSFYENMIIEVEPPKNHDIDKIADQYLGKICHVRWPFLREALVVKVSTNKFSIELANDGTKIRSSVVNSSLNKWLSDSKTIERWYKLKHGIDVSFQVNCLVYVRHKKGFRLNMSLNNSTTTFCHEWNADVYAYPLQLVVLGLVDQSNKINKSIAISRLFQPMEECYFLGFQFYGAKAVMDSILPNGLFKIKIEQCHEPQLNNLYALRDNMHKTYMTGHILSGKLSITPHLLSKICSVIAIKRKSVDSENSDGETVNIGLNLRSVKSKMWTPEFVNYLDGEWYYSEKLHHYIVQYIRFCPSVFKYIAENINEQFLDEEDCFEESNKTLDDVLWFLKSIGREHWRREYGPKVLLTEFVIQKLERMIGYYIPTYAADVNINVKPDLLFKYTLQSGNMAPDPKADFEIFDRVINVSVNTSVPYGYKGVVIGKKILGAVSEDDLSAQSVSYTIDDGPFEDISNLMIDVLFDNEFVGAVSINGSSEKAYRLRAYCLLNISYGKRRDDALKKNNSISLNQANKITNETRTQIYKNLEFYNKSYNKRASNVATPMLTNTVVQPMCSTSNQDNTWRKTEMLKTKIPDRRQRQTNTNVQSQELNTSAADNLKKLLKISTNVGNNVQLESQSNHMNWRHSSKAKEPTIKPEINLSDMKSVFEKIANSKSTNAHSSGGDKNKDVKFTHVSDLESSFKTQASNPSDIESSWRSPNKDSISDQKSLVTLKSASNELSENMKTIDHNERVTSAGHDSTKHNSKPATPKAKKPKRRIAANFEKKN